jgi:hypothetical protein
MTLKLNRGPRWLWTCATCNFVCRYKEYDIYRCVRKERLDMLLVIRDDGYKIAHLVVELQTGSIIPSLRIAIHYDKQSALNALVKVGLIDKRDIVRADYMIGQEQ